MVEFYADLTAGQFNSANVGSHRIPLAPGIRAYSAGEMLEVSQARDSVE